MPGNSSSSSDSYGQFKRAIRNLFRRRKTNVNVAAATEPQAPVRPQRPRPASAIAAPEVSREAPEVLNNPEPPSWPIYGHASSYGGGLYCAPVELPASPSRLGQQRSKSDAGQQTHHFDLFSELDATSIRRLSVIGSEDGDDDDLDEAYVKLQSDLASQQHQPLADDKGDLETAHSTPEQSTTAQPKQTQDDDAVIQDKDLVEPADIALPESSDSEEDAAGTAFDDDDASALYSTDPSDVDVDSVTDAATVSTPRTGSLVRADTSDYFDEKIAVLDEPCPVIAMLPAPSMAATSGPLEAYSW